MKVIKVDDLKKSLDLEKISLEIHIKIIKKRLSEGKNIDFNFLDLLEGKLAVVNYINRVIDKYQFEIIEKEVQKYER